MEASTLLDSVDTGLHADVVAFCPWAGALDVLACATYELRDGVRIGRLQLYSVRRGAAGGTTSASAGQPGRSDPLPAHELRLEAQHDCAGIFEAAWLPPPSEAGGEGCLLALACADGSVECLRAGRSGADGPIDVGPVARCELPDVNGQPPFCLAVDWAWVRDASAGAGAAAVASSAPCSAQKRLACCDNAGRAHVFALDQAAPALVSSWQAHELEVWTATHQRAADGLLLTGADDCALRGWDLRCVGSPAFANRKGHSMGVTSIQTDPRSEHTILTGSYDEHLRLFDVRMPQRELCALALGGGVWCARWHPRVPGAIVAACMHNGFHLARSRGDHAELAHVGRCAAPDIGAALAYGADWSHERAGEGGSLLGATCSFYDHSLQLWAARPEVAPEA